MVRYSGGNLIKMDECATGEAIAICHWNAHTCRPGEGRAGRRASPADLLRYRACALVEEEVGWLVLVGGKDWQPQCLACYQAQNQVSVKVH